jgi:DNA-binding transcriptional regulator YiaG
MPPEAATAARPIMESTRWMEVGREQALSELIQALLNYPAKSDRLDRTWFAGLIKQAQDVLEAEDDELADRLGVSRPTIGRWERGETAPHPIGRPGVLRVLIKLADEKLKFHRRRKVAIEGAKWRATG